MRIHRLEMGLIKWYIPRPILKKIFRFTCQKTHCACFSLEIASIYFTWLSDECLPKKYKFFQWGNPPTDIEYDNVEFNEND